MKSDPIKPVLKQHRFDKGFQGVLISKPKPKKETMSKLNRLPCDTSADLSPSNSPGLSGNSSPYSPTLTTKTVPSFSGNLTRPYSPSQKTGAVANMVNGYIQM